MDNLSHYIRVYDNAMPDSQCDAYLNMMEQRQDLFTRNGKSVYEHLPNSSWDEFDLVKVLPPEEFKGLVQSLHRFKSKYEEECSIKPALPMPDGLAPLTVKRYLANGEDGFEAHYDSAASKCTRYLVFLFYLNDVEEGGETEFVDLGIKVSPKKGRLLVFPPYWMYRHRGCVPVSNDKVILSSYYLWWK